MNFLFDNNLPADLAHAIAELSRSEDGIGRIVHLTDLFPPATPDTVWINDVSAHGADWYIVSLDKFKKSHGAEREALRRAGHTVYVLDAQWSDHAFWLKSARMVLWWPTVLQHARLARGGVHRIPWKHSSGKKFTSV
ncbi:hypothetical protein [Ideonella sp. YS5]|uniref:PIN-like domain-containing protein n=1 Tax=Ideonella sp. YS5 TaxID=3453714 RepID=UPI003EEBDA30